MKWHKEITSEDYPVYDVVVAKELTNRPSTISKWKQENIRIALRDKKFSFDEVFRIVGHECGYCFEYNCHSCPLNRKLGTNCCDIRTYRAMRRSKSRKALAKAHKAWCKEIGLWGKNWN